MANEGGVVSERGMASPKRGGASPKMGAASPKWGGASPKMGAASPKWGRASPKRGAASPKRDAAKEMEVGVARAMNGPYLSGANLDPEGMTGQYLKTGQYSPKRTCSPRKTSHSPSKTRQYQLEECGLCPEMTSQYPGTTGPVDPLAGYDRDPGEGLDRSPVEPDLRGYMLPRGSHPTIPPECLILEEGVSKRDI